MNLDSKLRSAIREIKDYPKPGIVFKDIVPILAIPELVNEILDAQVSYWKDQPIDAVAGIEARGFIFGSLLAHALKLPFIPVRKVGKLPYERITQEYSLEYGTASIEMHTDALQPGWNVLIHDDLLATGGTAAATGDLVNRLGGTVTGFSFLINLGFLPGKKILKERFDRDPFFLVEF